MIEKIIEYSIRNRFLVLVVAAALAVAGIYATLNTPVDAIPDLGENQVIVFTDWMGRSPKEIEDQVTFPLSVNKAGVPRQMILVGICEKCAAKDDATLLREGFAELRRAFPDLPEFKMHVVQEWSGVVH